MRTVWAVIQRLWTYDLMALYKCNNYYYCGKCDVTPTVTFPAAGHHRPSPVTNLYCYTSKAYYYKVTLTQPKRIFSYINIFRSLICCPCQHWVRVSDVSKLSQSWLLWYRSSPRLRNDILVINNQNNKCCNLIFILLNSANIFWVKCVLFCVE